MNPEPSAADLRKRKRQLEAKLRRIGPVIRGSVVTLRMPCTRKTCRRCQSGQKHPNKYLSTSKAGKTHLRYIPKDLRRQVEQCVEHYQRAKQILEDLSDINTVLVLGPKGQRGRRSDA